MTSAELPQLLDMLEGEWRRLGAGIADRLRPGINSDEIDQLTEPYGLHVPGELRTWWGWHDGVSLEQPWTLGEITIGPGYWEFPSLERVLDHYQDFRRWSPASEYPDETDPILREMYWHENWLPILVAGNSSLFVDAGPVSANTLAPVYRDFLRGHDYLTPVTDSFTDVVALWVELLRDEYYSWDLATRNWSVRFDAIPVDIRVTGLV